MNRGYIKFWRRAEDSCVWSRGIEYRGLLITLLARANYHESSFGGEKILPGQLAVSMQRLAEDLGISRDKLNRMLKNLEKDEVITIRGAHNRYTIITILNFRQYQENKTDNRTTPAQPTAQPPHNQPRNQPHNRKSSKSEESEGFMPSVCDSNAQPTAQPKNGNPHNQPHTSKEVLRSKNKRNTEESSLRSDSCSEQSAIAAEPSPPPLDTVITLPLNTGEEHPVTQGEVEIWQDLYPAVDVMQALKSMKGWLLANERKRKTRSGIKRFINAWLAKEQDRGGNNAVVIRDGPPGQRSAQPAARTQHQKNKQDLEGLAAFVSAADKEFSNGFTPESCDGTGQNGDALPASAGHGKGVAANGYGLVRTLP